VGAKETVQVKIAKSLLIGLGALYLAGVAWNVWSRYFGTMSNGQKPPLTEIIFSAGPWAWPLNLFVGKT
jgi:hypothetical protein